MKTNILTFLFLLVGLTSYAISTSEGVTTHNQKITIDFNGLAIHGATVFIKNSDGNVIFSNVINPNVTSKVFNLSKLPVERYILSIENDSKIVDQSFNLTSYSIEMEEKVSETFKPNFRSMDNEIRVNSLLLGQSANVKIIDNLNNVIYNESFNDKASINRIYSIKNLDKGNYTLSVYINDKVFYHNIQK